MHLLYCLSSLSDEQQEWRQKPCLCCLPNRKHRPTMMSIAGQTKLHIDPVITPRLTSSAIMPTTIKTRPIHIFTFSFYSVTDIYTTFKSIPQLDLPQSLYHLQALICSTPAIEIGFIVCQMREFAYQNIYTLKSMKMKKCCEILPYLEAEIRNSIAGLWDVMIRW